MDIKTFKVFVKDVNEKYIGFKKLEKSISKEKGVSDAGAIAASIGRKKYGKKAFQKASADHKKMDENINEGTIVPGSVEHMEHSLYKFHKQGIGDSNYNIIKIKHKGLMKKSDLSKTINSHEMSKKHPPLSKSTYLVIHNKKNMGKDVDYPFDMEKEVHHFEVTDHSNLGSNDHFHYGINEPINPESSMYEPLTIKHIKKE